MSGMFRGVSNLSSEVAQGREKQAPEALKDGKESAEVRGHSTG